MIVASSCDFIGNVLHLEKMRLRTKIRNKRTSAGNALYIALVIQFAQGAICRHSRNAHRFHEFVLGRHAVAWLQLTRGDALNDQILELLVPWLDGIHDRLPSVSSIAANSVRARSRSTCAASTTHHLPSTMTRSTGNG